MKKVRVPESFVYNRPSMTAQDATKKHKLGFWDSVAINIGVIIGVGIFRTPGEVALYLDSSVAIIIAWVLGAFVALFGVFCYASLASRFPQTGGTYVFLREAYGKPISFLFGWTEFTILRAGSIAMVAYVFTTYLRSFIPFSGAEEKLITCATIWTFTLINLLGFKVGADVQDLLSALKIVAVLAISALIFFFTPKAAEFTFTSPKGNILLGLAPAMIPVMFSYGGWHQSTFLSGEFKDVKRALPLSLLMSIGVLAVVYALINMAYLHILSPAEMGQTQAIASDIFRRLFGVGGLWIVALTVLISSSGALNSTILTGGVIPFAVAKDYARLKWLAVANPRTGTPVRSILLTSTWATLLVLWGNFTQLLFFYAFANWLFFTLVGVSVFIFNARSKEGSIFPVIGYPVTPALFIVSCLAMCTTTVLNAPRESLFGALLLLTGFIAYLIIRTKKDIISHV